MKLTKRQKEIVKKIADRSITDVYSFVKHFNLGKDFYYDKAKAFDKFNELYKDRTYYASHDDLNSIGLKDSIIKELGNDIVLVKMKPSLRDLYKKFSSHGITYEYNYFEPVYITENIDEVTSFIALWQYLKSQGLIIELPKSCTKEDMGLFIRKDKPVADEPYIMEPNTPEEPLDLFAKRPCLNEYIDGSFKLDEENFEICFPYLTQKIYPAPELKIFIQKGFNTKEELNNRRNFWIALAGVIIAIFTSLASIYMSAQEKGYYKELNEINNSLQQIDDVLSPEEPHEENVIPETENTEQSTAPTNQ